MGVELTAEQVASLSIYVERSEFASVEEAASRLIDERLAELALEKDDMSWAKPMVGEALAEVAAGKVISREEYGARIEAPLSNLKDGVRGSVRSGMTIV